MDTHLYFHFIKLGYNVSNSLSLCIFSKALRYPTLCSKKYQLSELVNYSQVDAQKLAGVGFSTCATLFLPLELAIGMFLMYSFIGVSFLAGVAVMIAMSLLIFLNSTFQARYSTRLLEAKDKRMRTTTQIFNNIRFIKASAWERYFLGKVSADRTAELSQLNRVGIHKVISIFSFWVSSPLILSTTFTVLLLRGEELTAEKAFTTIILFNLLQFPISALPEAISELIQMWASIKRISKFLYEPEI